MSDNLKITVSGVRGIVGDTLTTELITDFGKAFGTLVKSGTVVIGTDTRTSRDMVTNALSAGIFSTGVSVINIGIAPTPTVLLAVRKYKAAGGIVVTASHNPSEWNGLKFAGNDGCCLNETSVKKLIQIYNKKSFIQANWEKIGQESKRDDAIQIHINEVCRQIDADAIRSKKFKVAVDTCNGTGGVISQRFLESLGCKVSILNGSPDGHFAHDPEPTPKNLLTLCDQVTKGRFDIGFAQDPDADRLAIVSNTGKAIGEENTLSLALNHLLTDKKNAKVTVNLSTSRMIDDICQINKAKLDRSRIGEANVVELMKKNKSFVGGEGNGGLIYPKINSCRDSVAAMGLILEYMASSGRSVADLVSQIKQYAMIKRKITCPKEDVSRIVARIKKSFKQGASKISELDGVKIDWADKWLHARGSNTEPIVRVMIEAETVFEAEDLYNTVKENLNGYWK